MRTESNIKTTHSKLERLAINPYRYLCNYIPPYDMWKLMHSYLKTDVMKELVGEVKVYKTTTSTKKINGVTSSAYKDATAANTHQDTASPDFSLTGVITPEVDLFLHEIDRYLGTIVPCHPNDLQLLTEEEIYAEYSNWNDSLGHFNLTEAIRQTYSNEESALLKLYTLTCSDHQRLITPDNGVQYGRHLSSLGVSNTPLPIYETPVQNLETFFDKPYIRCFTTLDAPSLIRYNRSVTRFFSFSDIASILTSITFTVSIDLDSDLEELYEAFFDELDSEMDAEKIGYAETYSDDYKFCINNIDTDSYHAFIDILAYLETAYAISVNSSQDLSRLLTAIKGKTPESEALSAVLEEYCSTVLLSASSSSSFSRKHWHAFATLDYNAAETEFSLTFEKHGDFYPNLAEDMTLTCANFGVTICVKDVGDYFKTGVITSTTNFTYELSDSSTLLQNYDGVRLSLGSDYKIDSYDNAANLEKMQSTSIVRKAEEVAEEYSTSFSPAYCEPATITKGSYVIHTLEDSTLLLQSITSAKVFGFIQFFEDFESYKARNTFSLKLEAFNNERLTQDKITHVSLETVDPLTLRQVIIHSMSDKDFWSEDTGGSTTKTLPSYEAFDTALRAAYGIKDLATKTPTRPVQGDTETDEDYKKRLTTWKTNVDTALTSLGVVDPEVLSNGAWAYNNNREWDNDEDVAKGTQAEKNTTTFGKHFWQRKDDDIDKVISYNTSAGYDKIALNPFVISSKGDSDAYKGGSLIGNELLCKTLSLDADTVALTDNISSTLSFFENDSTGMYTAIANMLLNLDIFKERYDTSNLTVNLPTSAEKINWLLDSTGSSLKDIREYSIFKSTFSMGATKTDGSWAFTDLVIDSNLYDGYTLPLVHTENGKIVQDELGLNEALLFKLNITVDGKTVTKYMLVFAQITFEIVTSGSTSSLKLDSVNFYVYGGNSPTLIIAALNSLAEQYTDDDGQPASIFSSAVFDSSIFTKNKFSSSDVKLELQLSRNHIYLYDKDTITAAAAANNPVTLEKAILEIGASRTISCPCSSVLYKTSVVGTTYTLSSVQNDDKLLPLSDMLASNMKVYAKPYEANNDNEIEELSAAGTINGKLIGADAPESDGQNIILISGKDLDDYASILDLVPNQKFNLDFSDGAVTLSTAPARLEKSIFYKFNYAAAVTPSYTAGATSVSKFAMNADTLTKLISVASVGDSVSLLEKTTVTLSTVTNSTLLSYLTSNFSSYGKSGATFSDAYLTSDKKTAYIICEDKAAQTIYILKGGIETSKDENNNVVSLIVLSSISSYIYAGSYTDAFVSGYKYTYDSSAKSIIIQAYISHKETNSSRMLVSKVIYDTTGTASADELTHLYSDAPIKQDEMAEFTDDTLTISSGFESSDGAKKWPQFATVSGTKTFSLSDVAENAVSDKFIMASSVGTTASAASENITGNGASTVTSYLTDLGKLDAEEQKAYDEWYANPTASKQPMAKAKFSLFVTGDGISDLVTGIVTSTGITSARQDYLNAINSFTLSKASVTATPGTDEYYTQLYNAYVKSPTYTLSDAETACTWLAAPSNLGSAVAVTNAASSMTSELFNFGGFDKVLPVSATQKMCIAANLNKVFIYDMSAMKIVKEYSLYNHLDADTVLTTPANAGQHVLVAFKKSALSSLSSNKYATMLLNILNLAESADVDMAYVKRSLLNGQTDSCLPIIKVGLDISATTDIDLTTAGDYSSKLATITLSDKSVVKDVAYQNLTADQVPVVGNIDNSEANARAVYTKYGLNFDDNDVFIVRIKVSGSEITSYSTKINGITAYKDANGYVTQVAVYGVGTYYAASVNFVSLFNVTEGTSSYASLDYAVTDVTLDGTDVGIEYSDSSAYTREMYNFSLSPITTSSSDGTDGYTDFKTNKATAFMHSIAGLADGSLVYNDGAGLALASETSTEEVIINHSTTLVGYDLDEGCIAVADHLTYDANASYFAIVNNSYKSAKKYVTNSATALKTFVGDTSAAVSYLMSAVSHFSLADVKLYPKVVGTDDYLPIEGSNNESSYYEAVGGVVSRQKNIYDNTIPVVANSDSATSSDILTWLVEQMSASTTYAATPVTTIEKSASLGTATVTKIEGRVVYAKLSMRSTDLLGIITNNFSSVLSDITSSNTGVQKVLTGLIASYNNLASVLSEDTLQSTDTEALLNKVESNALSISSGGITYFPMVSTATVTDCTIDADSLAPLAAAYVAQLNSTGTWDYALPVLSTATEISTESGHIYIIPRYGYGSTTLQTLDEYIAGQTDLTKSSSYVDFMKYAFSGASAATFYYVKEANDISTLVELPTDTALGIVGKPTQTLASLITAWTAVTSSAYSWKTADSANIECLDYTFGDKLSYIDGFLKISSDCYATAYSGHNLNLSAPADNMSVDDGDTTTNYDGYVILSYILKKLGLLSLFGNGLYIEFEYYNSDGSSSMNVNQTAISENSIGSYSVTYYTETKKTHKIALGDLVTTYLGMSADDLGNLQISLLSDETLTLDADFAEAAAAYIAGTSTTNPLTEEVKLPTMQYTAFLGSETCNLVPMGLKASLYQTDTGTVLIFAQSSKLVDTSITSQTPYAYLLNVPGSWSFLLEPAAVDSASANAIFGWHKASDGSYTLVKVWLVPHRLLTHEYLDGNFFFFRE